MLVDWAGALGLADPEAAAHEALGFVQLAAQRPLASLTAIERDWLTLAAALLGSPDLLLIDQRLRFASDLEQRKVLKLLSTLQSALGLSWLVATTDGRAYRDLADEIYELRAGQLLPLRQSAAPSRQLLRVEPLTLATVVCEEMALPYEITAERRLLAETESPWRLHAALIARGVRLESSLSLTEDPHALS